MKNSFLYSFLTRQRFISRNCFLVPSQGWSPVPVCRWKQLTAEPTSDIIKAHLPMESTPSGWGREHLTCCMLTKISTKISLSFKKGLRSKRKCECDTSSKHLYLEILLVYVESTFAKLEEAAIKGLLSLSFTPAEVVPPERGSSPGSASWWSRPLWSRTSANAQSPEGQKLHQKTAADLIF